VAFAATMLFALPLGPAAAAAEREVATLDYRSDPSLTECGDEAEFRNRVVLRLGYDPFVPDAPLRVAVRLRAERGRVSSATVFSRDRVELGKRVLAEDRQRCSVLVDSVAAAVAIAIDPLHSPENPVAPAPVASPLVAPVAVSPAAPVAAPVSSNALAPAPHDTPPAQVNGTPWFPLVSAEAVVGLGVAPGATVGAQVGFGLRHGIGSYSIEGRAEATPSAVSLTPLDRVSSTVFSGAFVPCVHASVVAVCGVLRAGSIQSTALDVSRPKIAAAFIGAAALRVGVAIPVGTSFAFRLGAEGGLPLSRTSYVINGAIVWTPPPVVGGFQLGATWTFR
jgi:hypothetical protein